MISCAKYHPVDFWHFSPLRALSCLSDLPAGNQELKKRECYLTQLSLPSAERFKCGGKSLLCPAICVLFGYSLLLLPAVFTAATCLISSSIFLPCAYHHAVVAFDTNTDANKKWKLQFDFKFNCDKGNFVSCSTVGMLCTAVGCWEVLGVMY